MNKMLRKQDINFDEWNKMDNTKKRKFIKKFADLVTCNGASKDFLHFLLQETVIMAEAGMFNPPDIVTEYTMDHLRIHLINYFYNKGYGNQTEKEADDLLKFLERITFQHEGNNTINEIEIKHDYGDPQGELPFKYQIGCSTTKKSLLDERYKIVAIETIPHGTEEIINIDLWTNKKKENDYHINILIANHKLIYSGDCGTFVFGFGICTAKPVYYFFCGSETNPHYWREKCEASSEPIINDNVDLEIVDKKLNEYLENTDCEAVEDAKLFAGYRLIDSNFIRAYDCLCKIFEQLGYQEDGEVADAIIHASRTLNERYIYACEVIQWVCNMLQKREKEKINEKDISL